MKKLLFLLFLIPIAGVSQNKKEQIAALNFKLDSLNNKISNERQASKKEIEDNEKKISSQKAQLIKLYDRVKKLNESLELEKANLNTQKLKNIEVDKLNNKYAQQIGKLNENLVDSAGKISQLNNEINNNSIKIKELVTKKDNTIDSITKNNNQLINDYSKLKLISDSISNVIYNTHKLLPLWHSGPSYYTQDIINSYLTAKNSSLVYEVSVLAADKLIFSFVIRGEKEVRYYSHDHNQIISGYKQYLKYYIGSFSDEIFTLHQHWEQSVGPSDYDNGIAHVDFQLTDIDQDGEYEFWYVNDSFEGKSDVSPTDLTVYFYNASTLNKYTGIICDGIDADEYFHIYSDYEYSVSEYMEAFGDLGADNIAQLKTQIDESSIYFNFLSELVRKNSCGAP